MKKWWLSALSVGLLALAYFQCSEVAPQVYTSPSIVRWDDTSVFAEGLIDKATVDEYPFLRAAPIYHLSVELSDDLDSAQCQLDVRYTVQERPIELVDFLLLPNLSPGTLSITAVQVNGLPAVFNLRSNETVLRVHLAARAAVDRVVVVSIQYTLNGLRKSKVGFGGLGFSQRGSGTGILSLGYAYPVISDNTQWTEGIPPAWGDITANPAAYYVVAVKYPRGLTLVAPGQELYRKTSGGRTSVLIAHGPARDFAFALGSPIDKIELKAGAVHIRLFESGGERAVASEAISAAKAALDIFGARFGRYPYKTLTLLSTHLDALGLEFPGSVILASWLLTDPSRTVGGVQVKNLLEATVAHEVAHQWFYGMVGNDQIEEPWIDESLAQYCTSLYYCVRYGEAEGGAGVTSFAERWERVRDQRIPVGMPVRYYTPRQYSSIIYGRAPLFLLALQQRMGTELFDTFLASLSRDFKWRVVNGSDIKRLAERTCSCNLDALWNEWVTSTGSTSNAAGSSSSSSQK